MNLFALLNRGAAHAPTESHRKASAVTQAAEATRERWLDALMVDELRAWDNVGASEPGVVEGMITMLAIASFAHVYDAKSARTPELSVIRGAISAAAQCSQAGGVIGTNDARAFSAAATRARAIIKAASVGAIVHAAQSIRQTVGL